MEPTDPAALEDQAVWFWAAVLAGGVAIFACVHAIALAMGRRSGGSAVTSAAQARLKKNARTLAIREAQARAQQADDAGDSPAPASSKSTGNEP